MKTPRAHLAFAAKAAPCRRRPLRWLRLSLVAALPLLIGGCNLLSVASVGAYKLGMVPKNPAQYTPARTPMLVLVENFEHQSMATVQAEQLSRFLANEIQLHDVAPVVNPEQLQELKDSRPKEFPTMSVSAVAQALGAQQVLYVQLTTADVTPLSGGDGFTGSSTVSVKLIDAATGNTLWPNDQSGYGVSSKTQVDSPQGARDPQEVHRRLNADLADKIARLFYPWSPENMAPEGYTEEK
jgi:hypothetical protein